MNKKINIGVEELEEIEVGYDAAGGNMEVDQDEVPEGTLLFYDFVSSSSPLPVEDGHYDHIKYSHAWIWVGEEDKQGVADEFYRILSVGGTVFIRDYLARFDWETGEDIELTHAQWMERLTTYFNESKWDIGPSVILADGFTIEITLTKKEESVNMENKERNLEIVLGCMEAMIECSDGVPLDQPAHHNAKYTMGELVTVYEMIRQGHIQLVPVK